MIDLAPSIKERPMRRRAKSAKAKAEPPVSRKAPRSEGAEVRDPEKPLAEALKQQAATAEILQLIGSSPTDVQPVFEAIVESAVHLCDGVSATVYQFDGNLIHLIAHHHSVSSAARETFERVYPLPPSRTSVVAQAILDRAVMHVRDFEDDPSIPAASREMARA